MVGVYVAGATLLQQRNVHMSALHHIIGLILFNGNASKQVYHLNPMPVLLCSCNYNVFEAQIRLNHFQLSVAPDTTLHKVDQFACDFDQKVLA